MFQIRIDVLNWDRVLWLLSTDQKKTTKCNFSKVKSVFEIRIDVPKQDRMFQIRIECSKCKLRLKVCKFRMKIPMVFYARLGWI